MPVCPKGHYEHDTMYLLEWTAKALLEPGVRTGDLAIDSLVEQFHINIGANERETMFSWGLGVELYNLLAERRGVPSLRILETLNIPYRDDNRFVWTMVDYDWSDSTAYQPDLQKQVRRNVGLMEFINEVDVETAGDDAQEVWVLSSELFPYEDEGVSYNDMEGREPVSDPFHYGEWD